MSTPPTVPVGEPASLARRLAALCYDTLLLAGVVFCFTLAVLAVRLGEAVPAGSLWFEICLFALALMFFAGFWARGGQTLGMRAWRIRVVNADGTALSFARAALRFILAVVAVLPVGLGLWWCLVDRERRGWHDRWARTRVVRVPS